MLYWNLSSTGEDVFAIGWHLGLGHAEEQLRVRII